MSPLKAFLRPFPLLCLILTAVLLTIFTLTRIGLLVYTGVDSVSPQLWPELFIKGLWFDLVVTICLLAPVLMYEAVLPNRWRHSKWHSLLRWLWLWFSVAALLFGAVSEATFWLEFTTRFNFIALDYLIYTTEVIGNIRESYPVGWIFSGIGLIAAFLVWRLAAQIRRANQAEYSKKQRWNMALAAFLLPILLLFVSNIDQMEIKQNAYATELAGNGLFSIVAAARRMELDYDKFYRTMPQDAANATLEKLGVKNKLLPATSSPSDKPVVSQNPFSKPPRNVILISVESLSASFMGAYGATDGLTPRLDKIANEGLKFEQLFATGTRTVRGLDALSLGTPPIPGQAIVHRPNNDHLATIGELLKQQGFSTFFFYGGYGYFDNMNGYFAANDYQIIDRTDIPKSSIMFENVWGVADEALFNHVLTHFDGKGTTDKPFFAHIMTTSNHRPYTYPNGRIDIPSPGGRNGAVKYTDYAIDKFIQDAKSKPWFADTLFVIVADHCASVAGKTKLPVEKYHIAAIFYAPELLKPMVYKPMISQMDIPPTILDILGKQGSEGFFGHSAFSPEAAHERAFISNYQQLGYLKNGILTVLSPKQKVESFRVDSATYESTPMENDPELVNEAIAYYQTGSKAFKTGALRLNLQSH